VVAPDRLVTGLRDVEFLAPFKFHRMKPATLHLTALGRPGPDDSLLVQVQLTSRLQPKPDMPVQERLHFRGQVVLERTALEAKTIAFKAPSKITVGDEAIYKVYFHGPAYQVMEGARLEEARVVGVMKKKLPPNAKEAGVAELVGPRLVEFCFQTAGVYDIVKRKVFGLPAGLEALRIHKVKVRSGARLYAEAIPRPDGEGFDARVVDGEGNVYVELLRYRTVALPEPKEMSALAGAIEGAA
jgi:hypothetical protein